MLFNIATEIILFFLAFPEDIQKHIYKSAKGDLREGANTTYVKLIIGVIYGWYLISGIISKADIYTDIILTMEIYK